MPELAPSEYRELSDEELAVRCGARDPTDEGAWELLYDRLYEWVWRTVRNKARLSEPETQDIIQDVFVRAFRALPSYDPRLASLRTYFMRMINWAIVDHARKLPQEVSVMLEEDLRTLRARAATDGTVLLRAASMLLDRVEDKAEVGIMKGFMQGKKATELAAEHGLSVPAVYVIGRKLKSLLREVGADPRV
jgi:RNA polymerase sigma-70 factor (ECF subfamily)